MAVFATANSKVLMPRQIAAGMIDKAQTTSTVAKLSGQDPMLFGNVDYITFDTAPKAEFVEEGAQKSFTTASFSAVTATPRKAQVTMRFNDEVGWEDEDYQLGILNALANKGSVALSRALDLGLYHRINPSTGTVISGWDNYLDATTKVADPTTGEADQVIRTAAGLVINDAAASVVPTGLAIDPTYVWELGNLQTKNADGTPSGTPRYPNIGLSDTIDSFLGLQAAVGNTVSASQEVSGGTGVKAIVGDFQNGIKWGVQRDLPVELLTSGDPDGQGDLRRYNQFALRMEIVYAWYVFPEKFAIVKKVG